MGVNTVSGGQDGPWRWEKGPPSQIEFSLIAQTTMKS
jgi:hypothetical protein